MHSTQVIQTWEEFARLENEWNPLLRSSASDAIFLTFEWMASWASVVGQHVPPVIAIARDREKRLSGIAPLYAAPYRFLKVFPFRVLRMIADYGSGFEYPDFIARQGHEKVIYAALIRALQATSCPWDCLWLSDVPTWTGAFERLSTGFGAAGFHVQSRNKINGKVDLPDSIEAYMLALSRNQRSQLRRQIKKVMSRKDVEILHCRTPDELPRFLDALFALHHKRRMLLGDPGTFCRMPVQVDFYRKFAARALSKGWLWLYALAEAGRIRAVQLGYVYNRAFHQLQEGFDPDYVSGVGNVLRYEIIKKCIQGGVKVYDFLGGMSEHKRRWGARKRFGRDLLAGPKKPKNFFLFKKQVWPTGRYLKPQPIIAGNQSK